MKEGKILFCGSLNFSDQFEAVSVVINTHMHGQREAGTTPPSFHSLGSLCGILVDGFRRGRGPSFVFY